MTQDVKLLSQAFVRAAGDTISMSEVPPAVWELWVSEGIVELPVVTEVSRRVRSAQRRKNKAL